MNTTDVGQRGESLASSFLEANGFVLLARNWKTKWCEIDIIAEKQACLYFCEVKYRSRTNQGEGYEYVTPKKMKQMTFAAELWAQHHGYEGDMQLVVLSVDATEVVSWYDVL